MSKVKITGDASGTGVFTIAAPGTNNPRTITLPDATGTLLNSDGDGSSLTSLPAHTGNVAFPATQVASADANTLDDYEEGTWTPEFYGSGTAGTWVYHAANGGTYTKIGNRVFCNFALIVSSNSVAPTSKMRIKGFPFTVNGVQSRGGASVGYYAALALATQTLTISVYEGGATGGFCADATATGTSTTADVGVFSGTSQIYGTLEYIV